MGPRDAAVLGAHPGDARDPVAEASHRAFLETALTGSAHTVQDIRAAFLARQ